MYNYKQRKNRFNNYLQNCNSELTIAEILEAKNDLVDYEEDLGIQMTFDTFKERLRVRS